MREFNVLERCEHYFKCSVDGNRNSFCRILIDENSQDLPLGQSRLHVEDISDKNKHFANDTVFRLTLPFAQQGSIEICTLNAGRKNQFTYKECLRLSGKWEPILNEWVFSASVKPQVDSLREIVQSDQVTVEVEFKETISQPKKNLTLFGFELVKGLSINLVPTLHKNITVKKGDISYISGQEAKTIVRAGTVVRLLVPKLMLESALFREDYLSAINYKVISRRKRRSYS